MKQNEQSENIIWRGFGRLSDWFLVSICWLLCCVPVVTIVPACIALYDTVARCIRGEEAGLFSRFFRTFKNELGRGILLTALWAALCLFIAMGYLILYNAESAFSLVYLGSLFIPLGVLCWVVALESRFVYGFGTLHKNAFIFTFAYLPQTLAIVAVLVVGIVVLLLFPPIVIVLPGIAANLQSVFIEKVMTRYMPKEEA